jgi:hypothetical protein
MRFVPQEYIEFCCCNIYQTHIHSTSRRLCLHSRIVAMHSFTCRNTQLTSRVPVVSAPLTLDEIHRNLFYPELATWRDGEIMAKSGSIPWREIDLLKKGATLLKYSKSGAPRSRSVALSEDMRNVRWVSKNKKEKNSEGR